MKINDHPSQDTHAYLNGTLSIDQLREKQPSLFEAPEFWPVSNEKIFAGIRNVRAGEQQLLGYSAGGREIHAVSYGKYEPQFPQTTISSANASDRPESYYDPERRTRPVLVVIGSIHGGETEGIALSMNLISIMETGKDLLGRNQKVLHEKLQQVRLVIVPCLNPDGREAAAVSHLNGAEIDHLFLVQQGVLRDGTLFRGRKIKEVQPISDAFVRFRGGYYNDHGVNLQHDNFFGPCVAPENDAIRKLFLHEIPDGFLTLHAHGGLPSFIAPDAFLSPGYQRKQVEASMYVTSRLADRGIGVLRPEDLVVPPWSFYFQTWLHHMTGALPLLFEFCHGLKTRPFPLQDTLDTGLILTEGWLDYCLTMGMRPKSNDWFGSVVQAAD